MKMQQQGTQGAIRDFQDLDVWKAARGLRKEIYAVAKRLPDFEKFSLANQVRRASKSITANIAEGYGRYSYQENAQHCRQARGSVYELRDHLITCSDEGYITAVEAARFEEMALRVIQLLNGYLRSTLARKQASESRTNPKR